LALTTGALAQQAKGPSFLPGSSGHEPTNIAADKLDYFDKEQKLIYTGNVVAIQGESRLNASVLTILLDRKPEAAGPDGKPAAAPVAPAPGGPSGSSVRRMEGKGPITLTNKEQVGTGDSLVYDKPENKFYLIGNVTLSQGDNVTHGDKLVYDLTSGRAVVSSKGRVRSLIVPGDAPKPGEQAKPGAAPAKPGKPQAH
jgi:lipopolysaccharide export system protein LptA